MITRAYIVGDGAASDIVGGLTVRARQILSLRKAGVGEVDIVATGLTDVVDTAAIVTGGACVWHPAIAKRAARMSVADDELIAFGTPEAAIYVCGKNRTRSVVEALNGTVPPRLDAPPVSVRPPEFIVRPETAQDLRLATTLLLRSLEKATDGIASRFVHRPISREITRVALPWGITPNTMTMFAALFGAAGVLIAQRGGYSNILAGTTLFWIQNVLDGCDGEIARLKYLGSRAGEWLDQIIDDALNIAFLVSVGIGLARAGMRLAMPLVYLAVVSQGVHLVGLYAALLFRAGGRGSVAALRWFVGDPGANRTLGDLTRRDFLSLAYVVAAVLNAAALIFVFQTVLIVGAAAVTTLQWILWGGPGVQTEGDVERAGEASA